MKKLISVLVCFCLVICLFLGNAVDSYADPFTAAQIGAASYAAMSSWGISFTAGNATTSGVGDFMAQQVESYVNQRGGTIASVFGSELAVNVVGKMVVGSQMYNAFIDFKDWLIDKYSISSEDLSLTTGEFEGVFLPVVEQNKPLTGRWVEAEFNDLKTTKPHPAYGYFDYYYNGEKLGKVTPGSPNAYGYNGTYDVYNLSGDIYIRAYLIRYNDGTSGGQNVKKVVSYGSALPNSLSWNGSDYVSPTVINPSYEWLGTVGDYQDTNLEQLLNHILEDVEGNNLVVVGELAPIDPPQPTPTPIPIDPDIPLSDVPWEGLDTNLQQLYEQGLEEIGAIGDAQDAITDAVAEQTGAIEDALADNAGVVSGAIGQAVSDIQDSIAEQTETLSESATATAEATETIAEALEDEAIDWQKFDLRGLFPFCIPFDIYNMLRALDASPNAPHVQIPFVIESIGFSYLIDLDFSAFDPVAAIMRQMELICYGLALAWATSKVIKW